MLCGVCQALVLASCEAELSMELFSVKLLSKSRNPPPSATCWLMDRQQCDSHSWKGPADVRSRAGPAEPTLPSKIWASKGKALGGHFHPPLESQFPPGSTEGLIHVGQ